MPGWSRGAVARAAALALAAAMVAACGAVAPASPSAAPVQPDVLPAGTHTSVLFQPPVTFTVPDGWRKAADSPTYLALYPVGNDVAGIHLFADPQPASQAETCPVTPEPGIGTSSTELVTWIRGLAGLDVTTPKLVTVGNLRGSEIDVRIAADWTFSCPFANGIPTVPLFVGADGQLRWVAAGSERLRLSFLDVPDGGTVVVDIDAFDGSVWDALLEAARPIVASMTFAVD